MKIQSCRFVLASDLFDELDELWNAIACSDPDFTWGDNNRSLVTAEVLLDHCDSNGVESPQLDSLRQRVKTLPDGNQTYVDLEN
jgi:hypothetical protein